MVICYIAWENHMANEPLSLELQAALHRIDVLEEKIAGLMGYLAVQARQRGWPIVTADDPAVQRLASTLDDSKFDKLNAKGTSRFAEITIEQINALSGRS
jgi:hypothetical protein